MNPETLKQWASSHTYQDLSRMYERVAALTESDPDEAAKLREHLMDIILRVSSRWTKPDGFDESTRIGSFVTGKCNIDTIERLAKDPDVISVETARSGGRSI